MENKKKKVYITFLKDDLKQLEEEANYLGIAKTNYIFLILYLNRNNKLLVKDIQQYKALLENNSNQKKNLYIDLTAYLSTLHADKPRDVYSFNQYLSALIHLHLKQHTLPRTNQKREMIRKGFTVPTYISEKFDEILEKTAIYSKTLITYTLLTEDIEYHQKNYSSNDTKKIFLQYPINFDKFIPNNKNQKVELLEFVLNEFDEIID